ncbi:MAG: hypothetical protein H5T75_07740 [Coriobacteriia bacterium]|nr:hypothetical protein [Coriobacteriia bacterium]MDI6842779.1 hypothetical protein [Anaerosomatales bacterium]
MSRTRARAIAWFCCLGFVTPVALVLLASCTGQPGRPDQASGPRPAPAPLVLEETAWRWIGAVPYPYMLSVDVAYVVRNPNVEAGAREATLVVEVRGPGGQTHREEVPLGPVRPGETVVGGAQVFPGTEAAPSDVSFTLLQPKAWEARAKWEGSELVRLAVRGLERRDATGPPAADDVGFAEGHSCFTGTVVNDSGSSVHECRIAIVHRDGSGRIVACYETFADGPPAHGSVPFRFDVPDRLPASGSYEAFAYPWSDRQP